MECKVCGHKNDVWDDDIMDLTYTETEKFYIVEEELNVKKGWDWYKKTVYICPKCGVLQIQV